MRAADGSAPGASNVFQSLDTLTAALELAEKASDYKEVARLRDRLQEAEAASPAAALAWRRQRQVRTALDTILLGVADPMQDRLAAIEALGRLASPPLPAPGAEEALHSALRNVSGQGADRLRDAMEDALWSCWHLSGDEEVDAELRRGMELMEGPDLRESVEVFTRVIDMASDFAEAWNKRATAYYALREFDRSIEDCARVLKLKPRHFGCLSGLGMCHSALGDKAEAAKWWKEALKVHPGMQGPRRSLDRIEREGNVETHLGPRVLKAVEALEKGDALPVELGQGLALYWDVHRVLPRGVVSSEGAEDTLPFVYFFRVAVRNKVLGTRPVRSLARFYALRFSGGQVFPLMRPTEGAAEFTLEPGEEYRYSWAFTVKSKLVGMVGGMLFERMSQASEAEDERFLPASLDFIVPAEAAEVPMRQVESLSEGHVYMGQLDLTQITDM